jgi:hypothetical protein
MCLVRARSCSQAITKRAVRPSRQGDIHLLKTGYRARAGQALLVLLCLSALMLPSHIAFGRTLAHDTEPEYRVGAAREPLRAPRSITVPFARMIAAADLPEEHLWLARPFAPRYQQLPAYSFLYGSDGGGRYRLHTGIDIGNPLGSPVLAGHNAEVYYAGTDAVRVFGPQPDFYGKVVVLRVARPDAKPIFVLYAHLNEVFVQTGARVHAGDVIGKVGMTGIAVGPHLHVEVRLSTPELENARNPELWLQPLAGRGVLAGRVSGPDGQPVTGAVVHLYRGDQLLRTSATYPDLEWINPDDAWQENFVFSDLPAGQYRMVVSDGKRNLAVNATVKAGEVAFAEFGLSQGK